MCGIFCCIYQDGDCRQKLNVEALERTASPLVINRGPDCSSTDEKTITDHEADKPIHIKLFGSVLHLRGQLTQQPLSDCKGNTLLWNGEIFGGIEVPSEANDTAVLLNLLGNHDNTKDILSTLSCIQGPWSFVYYQCYQQRLWFGRDFFGRRSLLWHCPSNWDDVFAVSSVAQRGCSEDDLKLVWEEVPADGIYCIDFNPTEENNMHVKVETFQFCSFKLTKYPWMSSGCLKPPVTIEFNKQLPSPSDLRILDDFYRGNNLIEFNNSHLKSGECINENSLRTSDLAMQVVRSNDCSQIEQCGGQNKIHLSSSETTMNSISKCDDSNENQYHQKSKQETDKNTSDSRIDVQPLTTLCTEMINLMDCSINNTLKNDNKQSNLNVNSVSVHTVDSLRTICSNAIDSTLSPIRKLSSWTKYQSGLPDKLIHILGEAVRKRVVNLPQRLQCENDGDASGFKTARVGVLFSGGIDSIVLAVLADRFIHSDESIDLINVAFEQKQLKPNPTNKRKNKPDTPSRLGPSFDVPDRLTGRAGLKELAAISPNRQWNFIEVNVYLEDLQKERSEHITHLVSPLNSVLDDSIGCALWFAARGSGLLKCPECVCGVASCAHPQHYTSKAKVLLVGMGADEQLGGYARHRTKFNQEGWLGLANEMEMEVARISHRNLGRDDRCISDHGREARFPFLDEEVVSFLTGLPVWLKADPRLPRGTGEKILLRMSARLIGLTSSAVLPKRAIQFGSRIAKLEGSSEKGSDTCRRLK